MRQVMIVAALALALLGAGAGPASADEDVWYFEGRVGGAPPEALTADEVYAERLRPGTDLRPLTAFRNLRFLNIEVATAIDLSPLTELPHLESVNLVYVRDVDLAPLAAMPRLRSLLLADIREARVPPALALPAGVRNLAVANGAWRTRGSEVKAVVDALDWTRLAALRSLTLAVGDDAGPAIGLDLGVLRGLPRLTHLSLTGVRHRATQRSPLRPPFAGLPATLRHVQIEAPRSRRVQRALKRHLPRASVVVYPQLPNPVGGVSWQLWRYDRRHWCTSGSFWELFEGRYAVESDALRAAKRALRRADVKLLRRLEFDSEADGSIVCARRKRDIVRSIDILGAR